MHSRLRVFAYIFKNNFLFALLRQVEPEGELIKINCAPPVSSGKMEGVDGNETETQRNRQKETFLCINFMQKNKWLRNIKAWYVCWF